MSEDAVEIPNTEEMYTYVAPWRDGRLGWSIAPFTYPVRKSHREARRGVASKLAYVQNCARTTPHYLCRITIEPVLDSLGRPIRKMPPKVKP